MDGPVLHDKEFKKEDLARMCPTEDGALNKISFLMPMKELTQILD